MTQPTSTLHQGRALAQKGRRGDRHLVHMSGREVAALGRLLPGGQLPRNPRTGLYEAGLLDDIIGGIGDVVGGLFGGGGDSGGGGNSGGGGDGSDLFSGAGQDTGSSVPPDVVNAMTSGDSGGSFGGGLSGGALSGILSAMTGGGGGGGGVPSMTSDPGGRTASTSSGTVGGDPGGSSSNPFSGDGSGGGLNLGKWLGNNWPWLAGGALALLMLNRGNGGTANTGNQTQAQQLASYNAAQAMNNKPLPKYQYNRTLLTGAQSPASWYTLGNENSGQPINFFANNGGSGAFTQAAARGGKIKAPDTSNIPVGQRPRAVGYLPGPTDGQADLLPAKVSHGEYVMDASTVSNLGNGNNAAGARVLDRLRQNVAKARGLPTSVPPKIDTSDGAVLKMLRGGKAGR